MGCFDLAAGSLDLPGGDALSTSSRPGPVNPVDDPLNLLDGLDDWTWRTVVLL
jgi:hypothetical protein